MDILNKARKAWTEFVLGQTNNIDKLMTKKVDDYILLEEPPIPIILGNKILYIGTFTYDNEDVFFNKWALVLSALSARVIKWELTNERRKELLEQGDFHLLANGKYLKEFLLMDKRLKKDLCKLINQTVLKQEMYVMVKDGDERVLKKWKNCSYGYFKKWISSEKLIQMCFLIYLYNFDSQKKSLKVIMDKLNMKSLEETYIPFWLQNLGTLTGQFQDVPLPNIESSSNDLENLKSPTKKQEAVNDSDKRI